MHCILRLELRAILATHPPNGHDTHAWAQQAPACRLAHECISFWAGSRLAVCTENIFWYGPNLRKGGPVAIKTQEMFYGDRDGGRKASGFMQSSYELVLGHGRTSHMRARTHDTKRNNFSLGPPSSDLKQ